MPPDGSSDRHPPCYGRGDRICCRLPRPIAIGTDGFRQICTPAVSYPVCADRGRTANGHHHRRGPNAQQHTHTLLLFRCPVR
jgi:hypothetical protein